MLAVLLMVCVAAGIAWPFVQKRLMQGKQPVPAVDAVEGVDFVTSPYTNALDAKKRREELCPHCSTLNPAGRRLCVECKGDMPIEDMQQFWKSFGNEDLIREGAQAGVLLLVMIIAMLLANFLPIGGKIVVLFATICGLTYRLMNALHN